MNTLNLAYPERGDVQFKKLSFPDGQQNIVLTKPDALEWEASVQIISRLRDFRDLELIACANMALEGLGMRLSQHLVIPYLLGARSDRKFVRGGTNYLRDIIAPAINELGFSSVEILDAHSDVTEAVIDNYYQMELDVPFAKWVKTQLLERHPDLDGHYRLIAPDAGSLKKIYKTAEELGYTRDIIVAEKHREVSTGKILSTKVPIDESMEDDAFVIFDDICDGGRTFTEIAKVIRADWPDACIYLAVSHGIFSAGFMELRNQFTHIYTTNSVMDLDDYKFSDTHRHPSDFITQLDVLL